MHGRCSSVSGTRGTNPPQICPVPAVVGSSVELSRLYALWNCTEHRFPWPQDNRDGSSVISVSCEHLEDLSPAVLSNQTRDATLVNNLQGSGEIFVEKRVKLDDLVLCDVTTSHRMKA